MTIKEHREKLGYSIEETARKADLSLRHYHFIELGKTTNVKKETMQSISKALETTVTELFFPEEKIEV